MGLKLIYIFFGTIRSRGAQFTVDSRRRLTVEKTWPVDS